jgi:DNA polymerase III epsilon subunit-like protein
MKALIIDVETTGLIKRGAPISSQPEITEYCGIVYDLKPKKGPKELSRIHTLMKPKGKISDEITRITGITQDMVKSSPRFETMSELIRKQIERAPVIIAHNARFDRDVIATEFERIGIRPAWPRLICTIEQTMHVKGHRLNLNALHEYLFGEKFSGAHRADVDVAAVARCAHKLYHDEALQ